MANLIISSLKLRMICKLHYEGRGTKYISMMTGVSRNNVQKYLQQLNGSDKFTEETVSQMNDREILQVFTEASSNRDYDNQKSYTFEKLNYHDHDKYGRIKKDTSRA